MEKSCVLFFNQLQSVLATKEDWLNKALDCLLEEGNANVKVERLAREVGVTKGSFYWHFKDRNDLLSQTAAHWQAQQYAFLDSLHNSAHNSSEERLDALFAYIDVKDIRHDVAMRLWARKEKWVDKIVSEIDRLRLAYCESIFTEMGFANDEARLRAHLVYYYQIAEQTISYKEPEAVRKQLSQLRFQMLIKKD